MGLVLLSYGNFVCFVLLNSFRMAVNLKIALIVRAGGAQESFCFRHPLVRVPAL